MEDGGPLDEQRGQVAPARDEFSWQLNPPSLSIGGTPATVVAVAGIGGEVGALALIRSDHSMAPVGGAAMAAVLLIVAMHFRHARRR